MSQTLFLMPTWWLHTMTMVSGNPLPLSNLLRHQAHTTDKHTQENTSKFTPDILAPGECRQDALHKSGVCETLPQPTFSPDNLLDPSSKVQ